jgi:hypothetical protein
MPIETRQTLKAELVSKWGTLISRVPIGTASTAGGQVDLGNVVFEVRRPAGSSLCGRVCAKVYGCGLTFAGPNGRPVTQDECIQLCPGTAIEQAAQCVLDVPGCDEAAMAACFGS